MALDEFSIYLNDEQFKSIQMMDNNCLVEVFDNRNKTQSGISIPITKDNPFVPNMGIVYLLPKHYDGEICIGDNVVFEKYKGKRLFYNNRQFLMFDVDYILCKIS